MEAKGIEHRPSGIDENPFIWTLCKAGVPRILVECFHACVRFCADMIPKRISLGCLRILAALLVIVVPRSLTYLLLYPIFRLVFGNLYPAYASYKAVRTKNVKEYVKWMMYWIVFALFTCAETFTDVFFSFWFPFYYEIKTILVVWLLSPATKGSSILYRRFVHPALIRREAEIDEALARATEQGYTAVLQLGSKGVNYATTVLMQTAIKGGGGLVQHLKKSYSLSDLTGEKEDENRNTSHMHDETDMEVEPRRREHVGRRGYSPRRTQSSSNRMEIYFSEVDVDVRQPRPREPTASLTNIRSSDDISSGYSSGEALQSTRSSQGESLVRTSSVGARTRAKPRSTTKKQPEDAGEDSDSNDPPSSINISLPTPLSLVTPEQALEILLLLSQNSNVADYIKFDRGPLVAGNDDVIENTSQPGPQPESVGELCSESPTTDVQIIQSIVTKADPEHSTETVDASVIDQSQQASTPNTDTTVVTTHDINHATTVATTEASSNIIPSALLEKPTVDRTATDELCQNKFDELKQLLSEAHKAVNNIVYSQEKLKLSDDDITETHDASHNEILKRDDVDQKVSSKTTEEANIASSLDVWTTPDVSRSNSDGFNRAGKYHKKPAPKVPLSKSEEDLTDDADSQNAVKATLVIKTGTLKTFSNTGAAKDVFIAHVADKTKLKKSKRQRTKEGFSKLLTIPKSIFHGAFNRDHKGSSKTDDSSLNLSASQSRSNSIEPQETIIELAPKSSISSQGSNDQNDQNDDKSDNETSTSSDTYTLASNNDTDTKTIEEQKAQIANEEKAATVNPESQIREMSRSPKAVKKMESDIY
ncbi:uncharacterized protein LOC128893062 isoform X2 [Hylaeus anthracinus]|uniref:uncharacterized protein LOC128893062 isoform X2 n=1 Tax=Hylaeus anthracinus TaxID=313031 RepID=UPI0023B9330A|nr:uncharacterized protein LOC128893062 isoform X2 [Hylaeus anthracinus]